MNLCCPRAPPDQAGETSGDSDESSSDEAQVTTELSGQEMFYASTPTGTRNVGQISLDPDTLLRARSRTLLGATPAAIGHNAEMLAEVNLQSLALSAEDPAEAVAPRWARFMIFAVSCQMVQMFMSYDGGALPASLSTLQEKRGADNRISPLDLSIVNAMDKVGMVIASVPWGYALRKCNAKLLLTCSLLVNAAATMSFGYLWHSVPLMIAAKFVMGVTQALQGVWGTVWTVAMAPPDMKTSWLGMGGISAGLGNGIGTCVAGYGTANGWPYLIAFLIAGLVLCGLWSVQLFFPNGWLRVELKEDGKQGTKDGASHGGDTGSYRVFLRNPVFLWTAMSNALAMFQATGIQFLFVSAFMVIWATGEHQPLDKNWVTTMFLVVTGVGGTIGVVFGPMVIDMCGGFALWPDIVRTLFILMMFQAVAGVGGILGVWALYAKNHTSYQYSGEWGDVWLWLTLFSIFLVMAAQNGCVAALCGINAQVVPGHLRTSASGCEMAVRFSVGAIGGSMAPGIVMTAIKSGDDAYFYSCGLAFVLACNLCGLPMMGAARHAAKFKLDSERHRALSKLREVCQDEDVLALEQAIASAMQLKLQVWDEGSTAIGVANELVGQLRAGSVVRRGTSAGALQRRLEEKDSEIASLRATVARLEAELEAARGAPALER